MNVSKQELLLILKQVRSLSEKALNAAKVAQDDAHRAAQTARTVSTEIQVRIEILEQELGIEREPEDDALTRAANTLADWGDTERKMAQEYGTEEVS